MIELFLYFYYVVRSNQIISMEKDGDFLSIDLVLIMFSNLTNIFFII